jgi:hypothetical protein
MWRDRKIIALVLLMVTALFQTAVAHSLVHDDDSDHCSICLVIQQAQPVLQTPQQSVVFEFQKHSVYVNRSVLRYTAFAKADQLTATLSIRPPPYSLDIS